MLENNGGGVAGGIGVGQPYVHGSHNYNVRVANDRLIGNGGLTTSGGLGVFYGSNNYEIARSILCSNFSVEYGGGISHIGLSPGGSIRDNRSSTTTRSIPAPPSPSRASFRSAAPTSAMARARSTLTAT